MTAVSIGILCYNEAAQIGSLIDSLGCQSLVTRLTGEGRRVELICAPNGCTDDTASVAQAAFDRLRERTPNPLLSCRVCSLEQAGKSNAWNVFVHELSDPESQHLILVDADIQFGRDDCLEQLYQTLQDNPAATVSVGMPTKDAAKLARKSLLQRMSLSASAVALSGSPGINGALYCARGEVLRAIWMPPDLLGEDGFLNGAVLTDRFTHPDNRKRVVRAAQAMYYYETRQSIVAICRHQVRLLLGTAMNILLFDHLWNLPKGTDVGEYIRKKVKSDPDWLRSVIAAHVKQRGWWGLPSGLFREWMFGRFKQLRYLSLRQKISRLPLALAASTMALPVLLIGNRAFKQGTLRW